MHFSHNAIWARNEKEAKTTDILLLILLAAIGGQLF